MLHFSCISINFPPNPPPYFMYVWMLWMGDAVLLALHLPCIVYTMILGSTVQLMYASHWGQTPIVTPHSIVHYRYLCTSHKNWCAIIALGAWVFCLKVCTNPSNVCCRSCKLYRLTLTGRIRVRSLQCGAHRNVVSCQFHLRFPSCVIYM